MSISNITAIKKTLYKPPIFLLQSSSVGSSFFLDQILELLNVSAGKFKCFSVDVQTESFNAHIVYIMALVEHDNTVFLEFFRDKVGDFGVKHIGVVVDDDIGLEQEVSG